MMGRNCNINLSNKYLRIMPHLQMEVDNFQNVYMLTLIRIALNGGAGLPSGT